MRTVFVETKDRQKRWIRSATSGGGFIAVYAQLDRILMPIVKALFAKARR